MVNDGSGSTNKIFAYNGTDGNRLAAKDFDTLNDAFNDNPRGIWSDGTTMYVVDDEDKRIRAYTLATKARDSDKDITLDGANDEANGIWGNGTTIWVVNDGSGGANKLYAYKLVDDDTTATIEYGMRDATKDFDTLAATPGEPNNRNPRGIWSDGNRMWVVDDEDNHVYAYHMGDDDDTDVSGGVRGPGPGLGLSAAHSKHRPPGRLVRRRQPLCGGQHRQQGLLLRTTSPIHRQPKHRCRSNRHAG